LDELEALVILSSISSLGSIKIRLLIHHYGSAVEALKAKSSELALLPGFGPKMIQAWELGLKQDHSWKTNLDLVKRFGVEIVSYTSSRYPKRLLEIADHPILLYVKGDLTKQDQRCIAIVGTRAASIYGNEMAQRLGRELAQAGYTIVSGLARGVDTSAHRGALEGGRTIGVLGSGIACLYPEENKDLARTICEKGAVISEFPMNAPPDRTHFPQRNRIVSGMTLGTILIEAPERSGAMLTMERAISQGRPVFALPGRADQENFKGNHALIKSKRADLIDCAHDVVKHFDELALPLVFNQPVRPKVLLEKEEEELLRLLPTVEQTIEEIGRHTGVPIIRLNILLMSLVLKKAIKQYPGKIYKKV
jgi:DNA processing protein